MSKIKIIALAAVAVCSAAALYWHIQFEGSTETLIARFPDVDPNLVREVHKEMTREALAGEYGELDLTDDNVCDSIFLAKVMLRTHT
jgi:hypothetical protein